VADPLPRGSLRAAERAVLEAAADFGHDGLVAGDATALACAALNAAQPLIERDARRKVAREILDRLPGHDLYGSWYEAQRCLKRIARGESLKVKGESGG
jgi:hypothetical protein